MLTQETKVRNQNLTTLKKTANQEQTQAWPHSSLGLPLWVSEHYELPSTLFQPCETLPLSVVRHATAKMTVSLWFFDPKPSRRLTESTVSPAKSNPSTTVSRDRVQTLLALQQKSEVLVRQNPLLHSYLQRVAIKAQCVSTHHHPHAVRAFYWALLFDRNLRSAITLDASIGRHLHPELQLDWALSRLLRDSDRMAQHPDLQQILTVRFALDLEERFTLSPEFQHDLNALIEQFPDPEVGRDRLLAWGQTHGCTWTQQLHHIMATHRQLTPFFSDAMKSTLDTDTSLSDSLRQFNELTTCLVDTLVQPPQIPLKTQQAIHQRLFQPNVSENGFN